MQVLHSIIMYSLGKIPTYPPLSFCRLLTSVHRGKPLHAFGLTPHTLTQSLSPCGVFVIEASKLQSWDTMSLMKADLGSVRGSEHRSGIAYLHPPQEDHPVPPLHEPLHWRAKRAPKARMLSLQSFLPNGVVLAHVGSM